MVFPKPITYLRLPIHQAFLDLKHIQTDIFAVHQWLKNANSGFSVLAAFDTK